MEENGHVSNPQQLEPLHCLELPYFFKYFVYSWSDMSKKE